MMESNRRQVMAVLAGAVALCLAGSLAAPAAQPANEAPPGMVLVPAGEFLMGNSQWDDATPHRVEIDAFYLDVREVTNAEYLAFCEATDHALPKFWGMEEFRSGPDFPDHPVVGVSWAAARDYAAWAGKRLPTEAEWEYAARGGLTDLDFPASAEMDSSLANYRSEGTVPGGGFPPNGYGLFDMAGNVREWVHDYYDPGYYEMSPARNPEGPDKGKFRVVRGGGWYSGPGCQSISHRLALITHWVDFNVGFRCAKDVED